MIDTVTGLLILFIILFVLNVFIVILRFILQMMVTLCNFDLKRKFGDWAVITGSTDGIGKEYAKELARRDINIVLISRPLDNLNKTDNEIKLLNPNIQVKIIEDDFSRGKDELEKIENIIKDVPVGILVNNVGTLTEYPMFFYEISKSDLWDMINVNIGATALMTHFVIEKMKERSKGAIINLCSGTHTQPLPLLSFYSASKTLIRYFSDAIRIEFSKYGITVQTLSPSYVNTKMVSYNLMIQDHRILFPDAATYAKNAVNTLRKLDSTAGYWIHDILTLLISFCPMWLRIKISFTVTSTERKIYLKSKEMISR